MIPTSNPPRHDSSTSGRRCFNDLFDQVRIRLYSVWAREGDRALSTQPLCDGDERFVAAVYAGAVARV
jgi:hypothetical protein